jgi:hypothetical protein
MNSIYQPNQMSENRELLFTLAKLPFTGNLNTVHPFALVHGL